MSDKFPVPIGAAEYIATTYSQDQVVIWTWKEGPAGGQHVATWGITLRHSQLAAEAGNKVKLAAGWPEEHARAVSTRFVRIMREADAEVALAVANGAMDKATALSVFASIRVAVAAHDPELAEQLVPALTEAATKGETS